MEINKMTGRNLAKWIRNLETWLRSETNEHNIELYTRWLAEARYEQNARKERIKRWLRWNYDKKE